MKKFGKRKSKQNSGQRIAKKLVPSAHAPLLVLLALAGLTQSPQPNPWLSWEQPAIAQTTTPPELPDALPKDSKLTIDGSGSLAAMNQALKEKFTAKYTNTPVTANTNGSAAGLAAVLAEKVDLAAIGRRLTDAEKAQGLVEILIKREKIAMLVSDANPFNGSLTIQQFAKIFRGEIKDWSEVGGAPGPIKLVDQPEASDTRNAFSGYPVFKEAPFQAVATAIQAGDENPETIVSKLGPDGIGYITADGVKNLKGARAVLMHKTMPDDPRYPFSQSIAYVYKKGKLSPAAQAFLTFVSGDDAKAAIKSVSSPGAEVLDTKAAVAGAIVGATGASATTGATTATGTTATGTTATGTATPAPTGTTPDGATTPAAAKAAVSTNAIGTATPAAPAAIPPASGDFPWWLLALLPLGGLLWWGLKGKGGGVTAALPDNGPTNAPTNAPTPASTDVTTTVPAPTPATVPFSGAAVPDEALPAAGMAATGLGAAAAIGAAGVGLATAAAPLMESHPRGLAATPADPWDDEVETVDDYDGEAHGEASAEVSPRHVQGASGGLAFPGAGVAAAGVAATAGVAAAVGLTQGDRSLDADVSPQAEWATSERPDQSLDEQPDQSLDEPSDEPSGAPADITPIPETPPVTDNMPVAETPNPDLGLAGLAVVGAAGVVAAGLAGGDRSTEIIPTTPVEPVMPIANIPHEPITQLPPDEYEPLETDYAINPAMSPEYNLEAEEEVVVDTVVTPSPQVNPTVALGMVGAGMVGAGMAGAGMAGAGLAAGVAAASMTTQPKSALDLGGVDDGLPGLPDGYGESRIVLMPRDPQWAYTYWDVPADHRQELRNQGGQTLALRLYDVTDLDENTQTSHSLQQYACDEMARDWYLPIPVSDRDYRAEIGYVTGAGAWLLLARSNSIRIPPVYPSDWSDDQFITIDWQEELEGKTFLQLVPPGTASAPDRPILPNPVFGLAQDADVMRIAGSLYGSMHQAPAEALSSFVFPSGMGQWAMQSETADFWTLPTPSGMGMSGISNMSGIGMGASMPPTTRSRKFWLVADAELIVYGATEPDAQVTIGGVPIQLAADGTFRLQMSFQDGMLDFPIMAIAKDGEQMRQVRLNFNRTTPLRNTNTKDEAQDEQF